MKFIALVTTLICITSCGLFKKNQKEDDTKIVEEPVAEREPTQPIQNIEVEQPEPEGIKMTYGEICEAFLATLQSGSIDQISQYFPSTTIARAMSGSETSGKTDKEVQGLIDGMTARFNDNIGKLREGAEANNVDVNNLRVKNCLYFDTKDPVMVPRVLSVELSDGTADYKIPITVLNYSGKTYVFEILFTSNVFSPK